MPRKLPYAASIHRDESPRSSALDLLSAATDPLCKTCNIAGFTRRCLSFLGWSVARLLQAGICDDATACTAFVAALSDWLLAGAPQCLGEKWRAVHSAILHRCSIEAGVAARSHGWWFAAVVAGFAQAIDSFRDSKCRIRMQMALRCLPPALLRCLWRQELRGPTRKFSVIDLLQGFQLECPEFSSGNLFADFRTFSWHTGKSQAKRTRKSRQRAVAARVREHSSAPQKLCWAQDELLLTLEDCGIRTAQPPMQSSPKASGKTRVQTRPWPRFRSEPRATSAHRPLANRAHARGKNWKPSTNA